jgi:methylenetetrahydrofolate dehydrogenase (NADP+)/methenyltetrahydrofolate cyclohydrolase/formyltetrahydrofolate synthetase
VHLLTRLLRTYLPPKAFAELGNGFIKKVLWASFGSAPESWFFSFQLKNGSIAVRLGAAAPEALRGYIETLSASNPLLRRLQVQLGHKDSFVAWSSTAWACSNNIPEGLRRCLCQLSSHTRDNVGVTLGSLKDHRSLTNVQWHHDGAFYLKTSKGQAWDFKSQAMRDAWRKLWPGVEDGMITPEHLAQVAVSPTPSEWMFELWLIHDSTSLSMRTQPPVRPLS